MKLKWKIDIVTVIVLPMQIRIVTLFICVVVLISSQRMTPHNAQPSETTPLLPKDNTGVGAKIIDASGGLVPDNIASAEDGVVSEAQQGGPLERQISAHGREAQYTGMPEVRKKMKYIFPALGIGVLLAAADQSIVASSYGMIGTDLEALNKTSWIATAYFLTLTSFQPLFGKLSDIFGRKPCLLFGYVIFGLGCLGCGLAQNINQLVLSRAFAGIGGGSMSTVVSILLSDVIPLRERGTWQGYINIIYSVGAGIGAPLGGFFADGLGKYGWRLSFLCQVPLCALAFIAVAVTLHLPSQEDTEWKEKLKRIDFWGAATLVCAVFALLLGLDRGSNVSWTSKASLVPLCLSIPLFALFFLVEQKFASEPFAPGQLIFERSLLPGYLCNFFSFAGYLATIYYVPLYFQAVAGHSAAKAGLLLIPSIICSVCGSLFAGFYMRRTGRYYWLTVACYAGLTIGLTFIVLFSGVIVNSDVGVVIFMSICGFSNGIGVTSSLIALISNSKRDNQAVVTACSYLFRSMGSTTGVSLSATVVNQILRSTLGDSFRGKDAKKIVDEVRKSLKFIKTLTSKQQQIVRQCYMFATRGAFSLQVALVLGAAISAWFLREKPLSK